MRFLYGLASMAVLTSLTVATGCAVTSSEPPIAEGEPTAASRVEVAGGSQLAPSPSPTPNRPALLTQVAARQTPTLAGRSPTSLVSPVPTRPTPSLRPQDVLADRVRQALASLESGELEATSTYSDGTHSQVHIQFQFGNQKGPSRSQPALHHEVVYESANGSYSLERITWRDKSWQRDAPAAEWVPVDEQEGVWGNVQPFLPRLPQAGDPELENDAPDVELHWFDRARNVQALLRTGPDGVPLEWQQRQLGDGTVVVVKYTGWNTPVRIQPPSP